MLLQEYLKETAKKVDAEMEKLFPKKLDREWMEFALGKPDFEYDERTATDATSKPIWDFLERGGKRWRPALMLLCCEAVGGDCEKHISFVVLPELTHTGTIMVDDVEDNSKLRRGKPCTHLLFGQDIAINDGNLMYYLPTILLYRNTNNLPPEKTAKIYNVYAEEMNRLSFGQATDIYWHNGHRNDITEGQYLQMCSYKTGSLSRLSANIGAILGNASPEQQEKLARFASMLGVAFQIQDDLMNISPPEGWGKEVGDDINEGKRTLLVIHALEKAEKEDAEKLIEILDSHTEDEKKIKEAIAIIKKYGSVGYAKEKASALVKKAWDDLNPVLKESEAKSLLKEFADFVTERKI